MKAHRQDFDEIASLIGYSVPDNVAHAVAGTTMTVYGKRFALDGVDPATSFVVLRALC